MKRAELPRDGGAVVGGYELHLYCTHPNHDADYFARRAEIGGPGDVADNPTSFSGEAGGEVRRRAKASGWWIGPSDERGERAVLCPYHARQVTR